MVSRDYALHARTRLRSLLLSSDRQDLPETVRGTTRAPFRHHGSAEAVPWCWTTSQFGLMAWVAGESAAYHRPA